MLSKCLNPACNETFRYLSEGRIFNLELTTYEEPDRVPSHRVERYWLCRKCAMTMTVMVEDGRVTAQRFPPEVVENHDLGMREKPILCSYSASPIRS